MVLHEFNRRILAEDLMRIRRPDDLERYSASQRQARIDPNPHQVDAVIFALRRLRDGGCILADEVGLGKTIEAGLVIAQSRAEGFQRVLLIVPKSLIGQWQNELANLFSIQAQDDPRSFIAPGVYLVGREFAGSERGAATLGATPPFDLVVIDEAHEIFAGLHKRYDRDGFYDETSDEALMAHRVRGFLRSSAVLLLTATPMQNSLAELWGLVQYVEPTGTLLGDIATFRQVFCDQDDRILVAGQEHELQRRLAVVLQRTLRRQAQEFLDRPFTQRRCRLYQYDMSEDERSLYDDVTEYLLQPSLYAFSGRQRRLLLIGFHRRMASSIPALAASLENVAARLRRMCGVPGNDDAAKVMYRDLEDEDEIEDILDEVASGADSDSSTVRAELTKVEGFIRRAESLPDDAKARSFQDAMRVTLNPGANGGGSGKAVVFTESITTQEYVRTLLLGLGLRDEEVTMFRGVNDHERAHQAYTRWQQEEGSRFPRGTKPSREVAVRLALVHEFRTRSRVLICTEAGAKGLNLQFCDTVINYDLPWNPQRIEQRIGRCHRYSQEHDVTVVNFIARDNEAHQLTFEILSQKLDLFGKVLDASDTVLHEPRTDAPELVVSALSVELESDLRNIYSRSRTLDEVTREIAALRDKITERRVVYELEYQRTSQIIESRFDERVRKVFRSLRDELPHGLADLDRDVAALVDGYFTARSVKYQRIDEAGRAVFEIAPDGALPAEIGEGRRFATGDARTLNDAEALNLVHPLVRAAIADARNWRGGSLILELPPNSPAELAALLGSVGHLRVALVRYEGFEPVQRLVAAAVLDGNPIDPTIAKSLIHLSAREGHGRSLADDPKLLNDVLDEAVFVDQREIEKSEQKHFEQAIRQLERFVEDKILVLRRELSSTGERLRSAKERRDQVVGSTTRERIEAEIHELATREENLEGRIHALESREDEVYTKWREHYHKLRYQPPNVEVLFNATLQISQTSQGKSC
ncbi:MAG TPA: SNF2-related protein [Candidatus Angelobacter sp.]|nr:SNF2-related protein [Candidatus Angelobacter sp.]